MMGWNAGCALTVCCFAFACGPGDADPVGGVYDLWITTIDDSCAPNRFAGELETVVIATTDGVNIPLYESPTSPPRQDLAAPRYEHEFMVEEPSCPEVSLQIELVPIELERDARHDSFLFAHQQRALKRGEEREHAFFGSTGSSPRSTAMLNEAATGRSAACIDAPTFAASWASETRTRESANMFEISAKRCGSSREKRTYSSTCARTFSSPWPGAFASRAPSFPMTWVATDASNASFEGK